MRIIRQFACKDGAEIALCDGTKWKSGVINDVTTVRCMAVASGLGSS